MDLHSCKWPPDKSKGTGLIMSQAVRFRSQFIDSIVGFFVAKLLEDDPSQPRPSKP